jgi:hypothetical protein
MVKIITSELHSSNIANRMESGNPGHNNSMTIRVKRASARDPDAH